MKSLEKRLAGAVIASLVTFIAACTASQVEPTASPKPSPTEVPTPVVELVTADVTKGGEGVMVVPNNCLPFDPAIDSASGNREIYGLPLVREIHAGLTRVSIGDPPRIELDLAEQHSVSENATVYTFTLRKGLRFSDGSPLTASDVKWSWERALRMATPWGAASSTLGNISGASAVLEDGQRIREIRNESRTLDAAGLMVVEPEAALSGVRVIDASKLEVHLVNPDPMFLDQLAHPSAYVLKDSNVEEWNITWRNDVYPGVVFIDEDSTGGQPLPPHALPVGAGPFRLIAYDPPVEHETCAIARNEHYWEGTPEMEGVIFVRPSAPFGRTVESAYVEGLIDFVLPPPEYVGRGLTAESLIVISQRPPFTRFMALNPNYPPFDDVNIRRALLASNDLAEVYPPPITIGWPNTIVPHRLVPEYNHCDRSQFVSTTDWSIGETDLADHTIEFWRLDDDYLLDRVRTLLKQWRRASGLQYRIKPIEIGFSLETVMSDGDQQLRTVEVSPSVPSVAAVFQSTFRLFGGEHSHPEWSEVETMILDALQESDTAERFEAFRRIECHLYDRALVLPMLVDWIDFEINTQPWVMGFELPTFGTSAFRSVRLGENVPDRALPW